MAGESLAGAATRSGTLAGSASFGAGARVLGRTGLTVSPVGFGGYRVRDNSALHRRALGDALRGGVNLIDTSPNYGEGSSETLVGTMLAHLVQQGEIRRQEVVVVSKAGYLQGETLRGAKGRPEPFADIVEVRPDCWHCIHPVFLRDQLDASLGRMGLAVLDVVLLHNPEYFLAIAGPGDEARAEYRRRLRGAFEFFEEAVSEGKIGWYGVSSNGFVESEDSVSYTSLADAVEVAREVAGDGHHFGVAQMPMNVFELGAALRQQGPLHRRRSPLQVAAGADVGVLTNRPLNAVVRTADGDRLVRLADCGLSDVTLEPRSALATARKLEAAWACGLGKQLRTEDNGDDAVDLFRWGQELSAGLDQLDDLERWRKLRYGVIAPHLGQTSAALLANLSGEPLASFKSWWEAYGTALHTAFEAIESSLQARRRDMSASVAAALDPCLPQPWRNLPLSRKAVLTVLSAPVSCVLVGMRQPGYVEDLLALRDQPIRLVSAAAGPVDLSGVAAAVAASVGA